MQKRWSEFDNWSQLILKYPVDRVEMITKAPASGIWRMDDKGEISLVRKSIDWFLVSGENEAFYLRVYTAGDYRYHGADMGILVSRGRMQTDDRKLTERAKQWVKAHLHGSSRRSRSKALRHRCRRPPTVLTRCSETATVSRPDLPF